MISLRMGFTSGTATSNGSSSPTEIKEQVIHRKGFSFPGGLRNESSMGSMGTELGLKSDTWSGRSRVIDKCPRCRNAVDSVDQL